MTTTAPTAATTAAGLPRTEAPARRLRQVLAANATTSLAAGLAGLVAASYWSDTLGIPSTTWIRVVSAGLVVFALDVARVALRGVGLRQAALAISVADLTWVAATVVALAVVDLTTTGTLLAVVMGVGVLDFALLQLWFRHRLA